MSGQVFHAPFLNLLDEFDFRAVVERHDPKAAERYPGVRSYKSVSEMLKDPELELVIINTPNVTHYEYAREALLAGKHVVVEKPFTATVSQARELMDLAQKQQRSLIVFQNRRWDSDFQAVKQVVEKHLLGDLIEAEFHYDRYQPGLSYKKHKEIAQAGTGTLHDLGPHIIDQAICLFGKPEKVFARIQTNRPEASVNDYLNIVLLYPSLTVTLKSSLLVREPIPAFVLHGVRGSFLKSRSDIQEVTLQGGKQPTHTGWGEEPAAEAGLLHIMTEDGKEIRERFPSPAGCYQEFFKGVYRHIRNGQPSPVALQDALLNMRIIDAALESSREQQVISL
ncbi:Gfo/Idh/MocA family oxidoreductase [Compostibacter hankyongensis]|uniref:Gfo/Idh/MocA family oxidoreductase n=2 Tax=Compostibacter hankyongensis TaxID=1007089 RepID=A0ABP8FGJ9_9BACT